MRFEYLSTLEQIMTLRQAWRGFEALLLLGALQFSIGMNLCAQSVDLQAAAQAKAEGARQARALSWASAPHPSAVGAYTVFDCPGADGTAPTSINPAGTITGTCIVNGVSHAFVRTHDGTITTFDAPFGNSYGTYPVSIGQPGAITGNYNDANFVAHGFLRAADGVIATFDAPGAVIGTFPEDLNPSGEVAGFLWDANFVARGFFRDRNGKLSTFDVPGAGTSTQEAGTYPLVIDGSGTIAGNYINDAGQSRGFLLARSGAFTSFDAPGDTATFAAFSFGKNFYANPGGVITGTYFQPIAGNPGGGNYRVFIRPHDGTITTFDAATYSPCCIWSFPTGINPGSAIIGSFNDGFSINHGFLRASDGSITTFDAPGAGVGFNQGTVPLGITPGGEIMGLIIDSNNVTHGFLFAPGK
jgi:hypothetical protein